MFVTRKTIFIDFLLYRQNDPMNELQPINIYYNVSDLRFRQALKSKAKNKCMRKNGMRMSKNRTPIR
jgi:hypothetical protein